MGEDREDARLTFRRWGSRIKAKLAPGLSVCWLSTRLQKTRSHPIGSIGSTLVPSCTLLVASQIAPIFAGKAFALERRAGWIRPQQLAASQVPAKFFSRKFQSWSFLHNWCSKCCVCIYRTHWNLGSSIYDYIILYIYIYLYISNK